MHTATLTVGNVEITAILDVDTSMPLAEVFDGSGDPPRGGSEFLAETIRTSSPSTRGASATIASWSGCRPA